MDVSAKSILPTIGMRRGEVTPPYEGTGGAPRSPRPTKKERPEGLSFLLPLVISEILDDLHDFAADALLGFVRGKPICRGVKKKCRWHIFSPDRLGYAEAAPYRKSPLPMGRGDLAAG